MVCAMKRLLVQDLDCLKWGESGVSLGGIPVGNPIYGRVVRCDAEIMHWKSLECGADFRIVYCFKTIM